MLFYEDWLITSLPIDMPTAIISILTQDGFVFAADGRDLEPGKDQPTSDSVQKLYGVRHEGTDLIFAFSGTHEIRAPGSNEIVFQYIPAVMATARNLEKRKFKSLWHYAEALIDELWPLPEAAQGALQTHLSPPGPFIIFIAGFHKGHPKRLHITFPHDGQEPEKPSSDGVAKGNVYGVYPTAMLRTVEEATDGPLAVYRTNLHGIETMDEAVKASQNFIDALKDPAARSSDERCIGIGGHVHICTLTLARGFEWIKEPIRPKPSKLLVFRPPKL